MPTAAGCWLALDGGGRRATGRRLPADPHASAICCCARRLRAAAAGACRLLLLQESPLRVAPGAALLLL